MEKFKKRIKTLASFRVIRFAIVGVINTLINFVILNISFYELGLSKIISNLVATSCALLLSFILNRKYVFIHRGHWVKQFISFVIVTVIGTLVINNAMYILSLHLLNGQISNDITRYLRDFGLNISTDFVQINASAIIATVFSMVWNYTGYRKIVFREVKIDEETE